MKALLIGFSDIARRRVLPALQSLPTVHELAVASQSAPPEGGFDTVRLYRDYRLALDHFQPDLVYVSLINSRHELWAERALRAGAHVIVDKPAFASLDAAQRLCALAEHHGRCLAEATVYPYHPQVETIRQLFRQADTEPTRLMATLTIPGLSAGNFRYDATLGGGAMLDLGPYAVSVGRVFFGVPPLEVCGRIVSRHTHGDVETAFSVLMTYPGGRSMVGHFGFDARYCNHLQLLGPRLCVDVDRIFTTPPDLENTIAVQREDGRDRVTTPAGDSFQLFLATVIAAIASGAHRRFPADLVQDAAILHHLQQSAQGA